MKHAFIYRGRPFEVELLAGPDGLTAGFDGREESFSCQVLEPGILRITLPDRTVEVHTAVDRDRIWIAFEGHTFMLKRTASVRRPGLAGEQPSESQLRAPMPGQVASVHKKPGDAVHKGETLLVLEAMKMEIRIQAPFDGRLAKLEVTAGEQVEKEQLLAEINQERK